MHMHHHFWNVFVRLMCMHNKLLLNVRIKKNNSINILFSTLLNIKVEYPTYRHI